MSTPILTTTVKTTGWSHDGRGIAHVDGKLIFIRGALPDETVTVRILRKHSRFDEGEVIDILESSLERQTPRCAHFGLCGGCDLQHIDMMAQIAFKQQTVLELLQHQAHTQPLELLPPLLAEVWGYRRKARLGVKYLAKKDKMLIGFREKNTHVIANIHSCDTLHPSVGQQIDAIRDMLYRLTIRKHISEIEIAVGDTCTALMIHHRVPMPEVDREQLILFEKQAKIKILYAEESTHSLFYSDKSLKWSFHPHQFIQVHATINQKMIAQVLHLLALQPQDRVLDLFCGIGNFTLALAQYSQHVVGVEGCPAAVTQARKNAIQNQLGHVEFFHENLYQPPFQQPWSQACYDYVVLDPPRTGAQALITYMSQWKPKKIVYISCNPATFARDTRLLIQQGYNLTKLGLANMFPHTQHIETIALLEVQKI